MPNIYGKERPSKMKEKAKPTAGMLGSGQAATAGKLLGSRQQAIESAVTKIPETKPKSEKY